MKSPRPIVLVPTMEQIADNVMRQGNVRLSDFEAYFPTVEFNLVQSIDQIPRINKNYNRLNLLVEDGIITGAAVG